MQKTLNWLRADGISTLSQILSGLLVVALPLVVLPLGDQPMSYSKTVFFLGIVLLQLFLYFASILVNRSIRFTLTPLTIPSLVFGGAVLLSSFLSTNYPVEHLVGWGGIYLGVSLLALIVPSLVGKRPVFFDVLTGLSVGTALLSVTSFLQMIGYGPSVVLGNVLPIALPNNLLFNLSGSSLIAAELGALTIVGLATAIWKKQSLSLVQQVAGVITVLGLALHVWSLLPGQVSQPTLLPWTASWSIVIDTIRSPRSALVGVGPEAYGSAFSQFKPVWLNSTPLWNVRFTQASNIIFSFITTLGLLGLAAWLFVVARTVALARRKDVRSNRAASPYLAMLLVSFAISLVLPLTPLLLIVQTLVLINWVLLQPDYLSELEVHGLTLRVVKNRSALHPLSLHYKLMVYGLSLVGFLLTAGLTYAVGRHTVAQFKTAQAVRATQQNNVIQVYNLQQQATILNPYIDSYHRQYALTNITIAAALAQKADRTEEENQQFSQLIQQAIREAKTAAVLDPTDIDNWRALSQVYSSLVGVADGADQWALSSYIKAVETAPADPAVRVELGGVFYGLKEYDRAASLFQQAISLKANYSNAYYNLAHTYIQQNKLADAKAVLQQILMIVPADSEDYLKVTREIQELDDQAATQTDENDDSSEVAPLPNQPNTPINASQSSNLNTSLDATTGELATPTPSPSASPTGALENSDL